ncbi:hypothetical protein MNBD_NITROSPINAE02-1235 [hydrothermal vent metagenome]|uniref:Flagellar assembly protein FliH/Type III secretion system HrpE domain-containing protein n=1 Tax=hydrothermal vent metagenome TaxID=652676 RepID=A0A3B1C091_9ZZZZ
MYKIIRKGSSITTIDEFKLAELAGDAIKTKKEQDSSFKASYVSEGNQNFIPGGFDFDYEGGLSKDEILNHSMKQAEEIIQKAKEDAETIRSEAKKEGYAEGKKLGYEDGKNETLPVMETFTKLLDELKSVRQGFYEGAEEEMIDLVINVAKTVIGEAVKDDPSLVRHAIRKAVGQLQNKEEMNIIVNSKDLAETEKFRPELAKMVESIDKITFRGDPNFARGGCMVETNIGSIDARVVTQLEAIRESFVNAIEEKKAKERAGETSAESTHGDAAEPLQDATGKIKDETGDEG